MKRKMKMVERMTAAVLSLSLAAGLCGCGSPENGSATTAAESAQSVESGTRAENGTQPTESGTRAAESSAGEVPGETGKTEAVEDSSAAAESPAPAGTEQAYFSNNDYELKTLNIADPFILKTQSGDYYLYGTSSGLGYYCWHSLDLIHWTDKKLCYIKASGTWCGDAQNKAFWAPEVVYFDGGYYLFYCSKNADGVHKLGLAAADAPDGPFVDIAVEKPFLDDGYADIDPDVLLDDDGKNYLYYVRDHNGNGGKSEIYGVELSPDLTQVEGEPVKLLTPDQDWEMLSVDPLWNEGPEIIKHDGKYYLSYSANYYASSHYAVGYAVSDSPLGPFVKAEENPILTSEGRDDVSGPGHHCFTVSPDGTELWVAYHSHSSPKSPSGPRRLNLDRAWFTEDGKLYINGPTTEPQPVPAGSGDIPG